MTPPDVMRPRFPEGYVNNPQRLMTWEEVESQLVAARHYWLGSVRPDGRPHAIPKWAVWVEGRAYFDGSPQTRHGRNIAQNPYVTLHLESGEKVVIVEGVAGAITPSRELAETLAHSYTAKYAAWGYAPTPDTWDEGGLFEIAPRTVIAWTSFTEDPTRFVFPSTGARASHDR